MKVKVFLVCMVFLALSINIVQAEEYYDPYSVVLNVSLVNQNPDPASAGETVELRFMVENWGGKEANNVKLELLPEFPFLPVSGEAYVKTINTLSPYQRGTDAVIIKYKVLVDKYAVKGTNEIKLKRSYADFSSIDNFDIDVTGTEFAQIIYVDKAKLDPGKETELNFTITNVGNSPLRNLVFSWSEENGVILPVYSDDTKYIKYIDVGDSVDLTYTVVADINADSGLYQLDLTLKFEAREGVSEEMNTKAGIFIGGETDFDVTFSESSEGQTSLSIANTGNNPALSVTVRIPEQENFRVTGSTSSIIGNLDKGDYTIVSFQISQGSTGIMGGQEMSQLSSEERQKLREEFLQGNASPQDNELKVLVEYTDTTGVRHVLEKGVPIQFRDIESTETETSRFAGRTNTWATYVPYIILLAVVVVGFVLYRKGYLQRILKKKGG